MSDPKRVLGARDILDAEDLKREYVPVPEWGEDAVVLIRSLTGKERDRFEDEQVRKSFDKDGTPHMTPNFVNVRASLAAMCIIGEDGERLFTSADVDALGAKSGKALDRIFSACRRLSGISEKDAAELAGNSARTASDGSSST